MSVKFLSDLHLGHRSICKYRTQFSSVDEHDDVIKDNILTNITKRETLWLLGDTAFTEDAGDWIVELSKKCNLKLLLGNHCTDSNERLRNIAKYVQAGIKIHALVSYKGFWLSHAPMHEQELRGKINMHGHCHANLMTLPDGSVDNRYFNVCCEHVGYKPISFDEIKERML